MKVTIILEIIRTGWCTY